MVYLLRGSESSNAEDKTRDTHQAIHGLDDIDAWDHKRDDVLPFLNGVCR